MVAIMQWCSSIGRRMISTYRMPMPMSMPSPSAMMLPSSSSSGAPISPESAPILCGRGDKKTKKGKRFKGTYGNSRPKRKEMIQRVKDKNEVPRSTPWPLPFKLI